MLVERENSMKDYYNSRWMGNGSRSIQTSPGAKVSTSESYNLDLTGNRCPPRSMTAAAYHSQPCRRRSQLPAIRSRRRQLRS